MTLYNIIYDATKTTRCNYSYNLLLLASSTYGYMIYYHQFLTAILQIFHILIFSKIPLGLFELNLTVFSQSLFI